MIGMFVIHPRVPYQPPVQKDFGLDPAGVGAAAE